MITIRHTGSFKNAERFLTDFPKKNYRPILERYATRGVSALSSATPIDTGETANAWDFRIEMSRSGFKIIWTNSNVVSGVPVAILLQYGHGTGWGGYVEGRDYINPAMKPIFDELAENLWKEVTSL